MAGAITQQKQRWLASSGAGEMKAIDQAVAESRKLARGTSLLTLGLFPKAPSIMLEASRSSSCPGPCSKPVQPWVSPSPHQYR